MSIFGSRMKTLRNKKGETRIQVSVALGKSSESIKKYEKGQRHPDIGYIASLSKHFDVSADYILGLTDVVYRPGGIYPAYKEFENYFNDKIFAEYVRLATMMYDAKLDVNQLKNIIIDMTTKKS